MSYPTPWSVSWMAVRDADGNDVIAYDEDGTDVIVPLDDLVSRINAGAEAEARAERAEKALEESEEAMHQRIRATYDKAVADSWKTVVKELVDALDVALAKADKFKRNHHGDILGDFPECMHDWARDCGAVLSKYAYLKEKEKKPVEEVKPVKDEVPTSADLMMALRASALAAQARRAEEKK